MPGAVSDTSAGGAGAAQAQATPPASRKPGLNWDLADQLTFYGSYHHNRWNQLIHFIFVPVIGWSLEIWFCCSGGFFPLPAGLPQPWATLLQPNLGMFVLLAYMAYYLRLDAFAGLSWTACMGAPVWLAARAFQAWVPRAWAWSFIPQVVGWYMQIHPGHAIFEGRRPALVDSLFQSVVLAPLFVWFELLFLLGYKRQLHAKVEAGVLRNIAEWKASKGEAAREPLMGGASAKEPAG